VDATALERRAWPLIREWRRGRRRLLSARTSGVCAAFVFLFAFGEFEIASLLGVKTWTVALFDA